MSKIRYRYTAIYDEQAGLLSLAEKLGTKKVLEILKLLVERQIQPDILIQRISKEAIPSDLQARLSSLEERMKKIENLLIPSKPKETIALLGGKRVRITEDDILKATTDPRIKAIPFRTTFTEIEGKKYPVKGLISISTKVPRSEFDTLHAEKILKKLGFKVIKMK